MEILHKIFRNAVAFEFACADKRAEKAVLFDDGKISAVESAAARTVYIAPYVQIFIARNTCRTAFSACLDGYRNSAFFA